MMIVVPVAIASGVGLLAGVYEILHLRLPDWYIFVLLAIFFASNLAPFPYAAKSKRTHVDAIGTVLAACRVCVERHLPREMRSHWHAAHRQELQYLTTWTFASLGSLGVMIVILFVIQPPLLPAAPGLWWLVGLSAWMGVLLVAWRTIGQRHLAGARADWQRTHFSTQPAKR